MASQLQRTHPLHSRLQSLEQLPEGLRVTAEPFLTMTNLRIQPDGAAAEAVAAVIGVTPPTTPNTWVRSDVVTVVWLGPDEWLVIGNLDVRNTQEQDLRAAVVPHGGAAVDVSGQRVTLHLAGPRVRDVLAKGCAIDLHPGVFRPGACAQTTLGRAGIVLLADSDPETFTVLVRQSFAGYLVDWLVDAAQEYRA
jgi:sarcosine oxidase subunit gamma